MERERERQRDKREREGEKLFCSVEWVKGDLNELNELRKVGR